MSYGLAFIIVAVIGLLALKFIPKKWVELTEEEKQRRAEKRRLAQVRKARRNFINSAYGKYPGAHNYAKRKKYIDNHW